MKPVVRAALLAAVLVSPSHARDITVLTYNVENLFDADKVAIFEDYAETGGENAYSPAKTLRKIGNVVRVLKTFNDGAGPDIVAFNELEIDFTPDSKVADYGAFLAKYKDTTLEKMLTTGLDDDIRGLPIEALLLKQLEDEGLTGYHVAVGEDEPDFAAMASTDRSVHKKGQKCGLFSKFPIKSVQSHPTPDARDILEVELDVEGHPLVVFVNHWKSGASDLGSEQSRRFNARTVRGRLDAIFAQDPAADVIVAGDFNSQYNQTQANPHMGTTGLNDILGSQGDEAATAGATNFSLYNLWYELPPDRRGSDQHQGRWGTLMQAMITPGLYDSNGLQYVDNSFSVVAIPGVNSVTKLGIPLRWSNFGPGSGFSDHFPVVFRIKTVDDGDKTKRMDLARPGKPSPADAEPRLVGYDKLKASELPEFDGKIAADLTDHWGEFFRVKAKVFSRRPFTIEAAGKQFSLWTSDQESGLLRPVRKLPAGSEIEFIGQLSSHKGQPQFLVEDKSWLLSYQAAEKEK